MYSVFVVGTAGCGKSLLTKSLKDWMVMKGANVITVNLDPGAESLPYQPDVDVRLYVDIHELMQRYQLGPNGALVLATDMIATKLNELQEDIDSYRSDYALFDSPGQVELFAFRPSGQVIAKGLSSEERALIFIYDAWLCNSPENFLALSLLASSVRLRFSIPFVSVLNKVDLAREEAGKVISWSSEPEKLLDDLSSSLKGEDHLLYTYLADALIKGEFIERLIPASAATTEGIEDISGSLSMLFRGGEESYE